MINEMIRIIDARYRTRISKLEMRLQWEKGLRYRDEQSEHRLIAEIDRLRLANEREVKPLINAVSEHLMRAERVAL